MEREICLRCGGKMSHISQKKLQLGEYGIFLGHFDHLVSGSLAVDIYCCTDCRKLEFYAAEPPETESGSIAQAPCPYCGQLHDLDDPKCPLCGARLLE